LRQGSNLGGQIGLWGVWLDTQEATQTLTHFCVMQGGIMAGQSGRHRPEGVIASRAGAHAEEKPGALQVRNLWDGIQEFLLFGLSVSGLSHCVFWRADW